MSKTNYSKMSRKTEEEMVAELIVGVDPATETDVTVEEEIAIPAPQIGVVANCAKLNVRKNPNATADILTIIDKGTEVEIDETFNNKDFYKVSAATTGVKFFSGFCMKKFIELK